MKQKIILLMMLMVVCVSLSSAYWDFTFKDDYEDLCDKWDQLGYASQAECWADLADHDSGGDMNPREDDWYEVEDWEIAYCSSYVASTYPHLASDDANALGYTSQLVYTVQGEYTNMTNEATGEVLYLYEVNYYLYAFEDSYTYSVWLVSTDSNDIFHQVMGNTALTADTTQSGYEVVYSEVWYDQVQIDVAESGSSIANSLNVNLVNKDTGAYGDLSATGVSAGPYTHTTPA